jgi:hypothetical protein
MICFYGGLSLAVVTLPIAWGALVKSPHYQSPRWSRFAPVASSKSATLLQLTTSGEIVVNADWFDVILREARQQGDPLVQRALPQAEEGRKRTGETYNTIEPKV